MFDRLRDFWADPVNSESDYPMVMMMIDDDDDDDEYTRI